jgi:hypothetical protein
MKLDLKLDQQLVDLVNKSLALSEISFFLTGLLLVTLVAIVVIIAQQRRVNDKMLEITWFNDKSDLQFDEWRENLRLEAEAQLSEENKKWYKKLLN